MNGNSLKREQVIEDGARNTKKCHLQYIEQFPSWNVLKLRKKYQWKMKAQMSD